jgi:AraC-like DNA-binding protein
MSNMKSGSQKINVNTISEYHKLMNLSLPKHPLLSVINFQDATWNFENLAITIVHDFYSVVLKMGNNPKCKYGQKEEISISDGGLHFMSPKQVLSTTTVDQGFAHAGWLILIHPDLIWNTSLANKIKHYDFFSYEIHEGLRLSPSEIDVVLNMIKDINYEISNSIDPNSKEVIIARIELLLAYSHRIFKRQFTSNKKQDHRTLERLELLISQYLNSNDLATRGTPSIYYIADQLHLSPNYLSRLLQSITGRSTKHYLQDKIIALAKEKLSTTQLSISEIAYTLGFKTPQSFSKSFKAKTSLTPLEFRKAFID